MKPRTRWTAVIAGCVAAAAVTAAAVYMIPNSPEVALAPTAKAVSLPVDRPSRTHGASVDFTSSSVSGTSMADAMSRMSTKVSLPSTSSVGEPTKVVLDETNRELTGKYGLLVTYASGIRLLVVPGTIDIDRAQEATGWGSFDDGRKELFEVRTIAGRKSIVNPGGIQTTAAAHRVEPVVTWNSNGMVYTLTSSGSDPVGLSELLSVAQSMK